MGYVLLGFLSFFVIHCAPNLVCFFLNWFFVPLYWFHQRYTLCLFQSSHRQIPPQSCYPYFGTCLCKFLSNSLLLALLQLNSQKNLSILRKQFRSMIPVLYQSTKISIYSYQTIIKSPIHYNTWHVHPWFNSNQKLQPENLPSFISTDTINSKLPNFISTKVNRLNWIPHHNKINM